MTEDEPRRTGIVKWYSLEHDVGVITMDGVSVWVYRSSIRDPKRKLSPGEEVEFTLGHSHKGPMARSVVRVSTKTDEEIIARALKMIDEMEW